MQTLPNTIIVIGVYSGDCSRTYMYNSKHTQIYTYRLTDTLAHAHLYTNSHALSASVA